MDSLIDINLQVPPSMHVANVEWCRLVAGTISMNENP